MSFISYETSQELGEPIELFEFRLGGEAFRMTSAQVPITILGGDWDPVAIEHSAFKSSPANSRADKVEIKMPGDHLFVQRFINVLPGQLATLTIYKTHRDDPDQEVVTSFRGGIQSVAFTDNAHRAILQVLPLTVARSRQIPRLTYSGLCGHMLYDARCKIAENNPDFQKFLHISSVIDNVITADGASGFGFADFFEQGFVAFDGDFRMVVKQSGDDLTLVLPFGKSPLGHTIRCQAGCKLRLELDCKNRFDNVINAAAFGFVPGKNPFLTGLD